MFLDPLKATLFEVLLNRRSRRLGLGMTIPAGPLRYKSPHAPVPLTEDEEAALAFAACGITGYALADLSYGAGEGGSMLVGKLGRTVASPDAVNAVSVLVTNDSGTWLLKRPQDFAPAEFLELVSLAQKGALTDLYRRARIQLSANRTAPPLDPGHNFSINRWSLYAPGTTYFLPIIETTTLTINALLELFGEDMGVFLRDERAWFSPAGIGRFARTPGRKPARRTARPPLRDDSNDGIVAAGIDGYRTGHGSAEPCAHDRSAWIGRLPEFRAARVQLVQGSRLPHAIHAGKSLRRCSAASGYSGAVAWKRSCVGISSRIGTGQPDAVEAILPALLQINGECGLRLRASQVRGRWTLPRWNATECLA